jgi:hypothetical protein
MAISPRLSRITDGKVHDVNILDEFLPEAGAFYVMDRGYIDFQRLFRVHALLGILRRTHQRECLAAAALLPSSGQDHRRAIRSHRHSDCDRLRESLSRFLATCQLSRFKQHLRIKAFYGTSENAVKTQIWIAVSVYVLVAIARKRLGLEVSLYQILQILSVTIFEKVPILQAFEALDSQSEFFDSSNQMFNIYILHKL